MAFTYTGEKVDLGFGRGWLNGPAAASIKRIDRQIGHPLQITEAGRTWLQQNEHYQHYLRYGSPIALNPDTPSLHQKGNAADSNEAQRIHSTMEDHGWRRTVYRWVNGKWTLVEPWHYEYFPEYDNHRSSSGESGADDMSVKDIYEARDEDGRNMLDLGRQIRADLATINAALAKGIANVPAATLGRQVIRQGRADIAGKGTSLGAVVAWYDEHIVGTREAISKVSAGDVDVEQLAAELRSTLAPEIAKALGTALLNGSK